MHAFAIARSKPEAIRADRNSFLNRLRSFLLTKWLKIITF